MGRTVLGGGSTQEMVTPQGREDAVQRECGQ